MNGSERKKCKISKISILSCVLAVSIVFSNAASVKAIEGNNVMLSNSNNPAQINNEYKSLSNTQLEAQVSLNNIENVLSIKAKNPSFLPKRSSSESFRINKFF